MLVHTQLLPAFLRDVDGNLHKVRMTDTRAKLWRKPRSRKMVFTRVFRGDVANARLVADLLTTKKMEESLELAWTTKQAMVSHLDTHYDIVDHGVKTGPFYVLRFTAMPSILAEIAFLSNPTEERLMQGRAFLSRIAEGLFEGVKAFINPPQVGVQGGLQGS